MSSEQSRSTQAAVSGSTTSHLKGNFLQKKVGTSTTSVKPELLNAHRALRELRSLHGNRALHESRKSSQLWTRQSQKSTSNSALMQQITNPRNLYHNDTVKHLMRQLSNVNHISYGKLVNRSGENEVFCSEVKLQSRTSEENRSSSKNESLDHNMRTGFHRSESSKQNTHHVMNMIERQILRDITRQFSRPSRSIGVKIERGEDPDTKTHSEELPGGMKVVITKTMRRADQSKKANVTKETNLPSISLSNQSAPATMKRSKHSSRYEWSSLGKREVGKELFPAMNGVRINGKSPEKSQKEASEEGPGKAVTYNRLPKSYTTPHVGKSLLTSLPRIQEEPADSNLRSSSQDQLNKTRIHQATENAKLVKDGGKFFSPEMFSPPLESVKPKVKLPILGRSIGQQRDLNYESSSKFTKPSLHELKRIIHGLYGDYFDTDLNGYYTYEKQLNASKVVNSDADAPLHYVTPAWDESNSPAASHTLQLFQNGSKRPEDSFYKQNIQRTPASLIRSKIGKAIASSKYDNDPKLEQVSHDFSSSERISHSQPIIRYDTHDLGDVSVGSRVKISTKSQENQQIPSESPLSGRSEEKLQMHFARQVALYHEQIEREKRSLGNDSRNREKNANYAQSDLDRDALPKILDCSEKQNQMVNLEVYLEAKHKHSLERKARLRHIKEKQKERKEKQKNKYLDVVEQREAFLAQVATKAAQEPPRAPTNSECHYDGNSTEEIEFEYIHDDSRYENTPITIIRQHGDDPETKKTQKKQPMETKIYRIFGERKRSGNSSTRWVAEAPLPFTSRIIKKQVSRSEKNATRTTVLTGPRQSTRRTHFKTRMMTDLVSRFQVATRYKLDREYVKSLASGTT